MSQSQFHLEVYEPGSSTTVVGSWPIASPIGMAVGDVLHTGALVPTEPPRSLKVVRVEHALWPQDGLLGHKLMVFTQLV
jgi:hypothetical protein